MKITTVLALMAGFATTTAALAGDYASRDEVRSIVAEALADAQSRSSLLQGGGAAGYDKGFYVASPNGDWKLNVNGAIQFRYMFDKRSKNSTADSSGLFVDNNDDMSNGFQMRRAFLNFSGNIVNPNLEYCIRLTTASAGSTDYGHIGTPAYVAGKSGNSAAMDDLYMRYNFGNGWKIKAGQFKGAFLKEASNADTTTMGAERGIMYSAFNPGRTQGLSFTYDRDQWKFVGEITDGFNAVGSDFNDFPTGAVGFGGRPAGESEFAFTGRLEFLIAGKWDALRDYTSKPNDPSSAYLGGAVHYEQSTDTGGYASNRTTWFGATVDGQWEGNGWSLFGSIAMAHANPAAGWTDTTDWGACAQLSYRWDEAPELFVRWDGIKADSDRGFKTNTMHFISFGYNNYFAGNTCKFTVDAVVSLSATDNGPSGMGLATTSFVPGWNDNFGVTFPGTNNGPPTLNSGNGLQGQGKSGEFAVRAQWQVAF